MKTSVILWMADVFIAPSQGALYFYHKPTLFGIYLMRIISNRKTTTQQAAET